VKSSTLVSAREIVMKCERISYSKETLFMCIMKVNVRYSLIRVDREISVKRKIAHNPWRNKTFVEIVASAERRSLPTYFKVRPGRA
jgi:hypothetical protein